MLRILLPLLLALGFSTSAAATTFVPVDFAELVTAARAVVRGQIVEVRTVRTGDRGFVETHVTLAADEYFKGDFGGTVTFMVPGGELGRFRTILVGAPRFAVGDQVVLFLDAKGPRLPWVSGLSQGVFRVIHPAGAGEPLVTPPPVAAGVTTGPARRVVRGDPARQPLALSEFARAVRAVVEQVR